MKKEITTALLTLATALGFAQEAIPEVLPNVAHLAMAPALPSIKEKVAPKGSFGYLRMGVSDSDLQTTDIEMLPALVLDTGLSLEHRPLTFQDLSIGEIRSQMRGERGPIFIQCPKRTTTIM